MGELTIKRGTKGEVIKEADTVHCIWVYDFFDQSLTGYHGDSLEEGANRVLDAEVVYGHNILMYDLPVLERVFKRKRRPKQVADDSLIRSRVLWPEHGSAPLPGGGMDLDAWGMYLVKQRLLDRGKAKFDGPWDQWSAKMHDYCRQDVVTQVGIKRYLDSLPQNERVVRIEHAVTEIIARQIANGWTFDREAAAKMIAEFDIQRAGLLDQLHEAFPPVIEEMKTPQYYNIVSKSGKVLASGPTKGGTEAILKALLKAKGVKRKDFTGSIVPGPMRTKEHPFNPGSSMQIVQRLKEKYGWKPTELTDGGRVKEENGEPLEDGDYRCDYDVLVKLDYPEIKLLLAYGDVDKMLEMLVDYERRAALSRDGKIHGTLNVQGAVTGRMTHNQPNMGNVPKAEKDKDGNYKGVSWRIRTLFLPRPGWVEVGADASALEDRMLRNRMGRYDPKELVLGDGDMHTENMNILRTVVPTCTRDNAKTFWYGILYGAGDKKAGKIVGRSESVGKEMKTVFFSKRAALGKLIEWCKNQAKTAKKLTLLDGRVVPCRHVHAALNTQLQGDGACVMKAGLILLDHALQRKYAPGTDYEFLGNIHDEWQIECRPEIAEDVGTTAVWAIAEAGRRLGVKVPLTGEYKVGKSWADCH